MWCIYSCSKEIYTGYVLLTYYATSAFTFVHNNNETHDTHALNLNDAFLLEREMQGEDPRCPVNSRTLTHIRLFQHKPRARTFPSTSTTLLPTFTPSLTDRRHPFAMPPKQVYGKRSAAARAANYSKFLFPEKEDEVVGKNTGSEKKSGRNDNSIEKAKVKHGEIIDVEKKLGSLSIKDEDDPRMLRKKRKESKSKSDKPRLEGPTSPKTRQRVPGAVDIEKCLEALSLRDEDMIVPGENGSKVGRKVLETRDANALKNEKKQKKQRQKDKTVNKKEKKAEIASTEKVFKDKLDPDEQSTERITRLATALNEITPEDQAEDTTVPKTPMRTASKKKKKRIVPQFLSPISSAAEPDNVYTTYTSPLLSLSEQRRIIPFEEWSTKLDACMDVQKIAEASFSEVYRLTVRSTVLSSAPESVLKVVALRTPPDAPLPSEATDRPHRKAADITKQLEKERAHRDEENEWKSAVEDVLCEVRLLQNLTPIPGFTNFRCLSVVQGRPSASFAKAWKAWNKTRSKDNKSEFPDPSKKASYEENQLWAVIEMQDAGTDCGKVIEAGGITSVWEVWDVFWGVCLSVAKAEEACRFEHRDMHMDNICVRSSQEGNNVTHPTIRNPLKRKLGFSGLETTVIDYTLSRADIIGGSSLRDGSLSPASSYASLSSGMSNSSRNHTKAEIAYLDLNKDPALFEGDAAEEYQYEIYRYMWGAVHHNDPLNQSPVSVESTAEERNQRLDEEIYTPLTPRRSPRKHKPTIIPETPQPYSKTSSPSSYPADYNPADPWSSFHPLTNLVWTHFILHTFLKHLSSLGAEPSLLSPSELISNIPDAKLEDAERIHRKAGKLWKILGKVGGLIEPSALSGKKRRVGSVRDLVLLALEAGWLGAGDVVGR